MATHEEEKRLLRDAETAERESERVEPARLNAAMRGGIGRGKRRESRRKVFYGSGLATAAVAAIIAFSAALLPGAGQDSASPGVTAGVQTGDTANSGGEQARKPGYESIDDYRSLGLEVKYFDAINEGYMRSLGRSVEQDGYTLTLKGAAMDDRTLYMIAQLRNDTEETVSMSGFRVDFGDAYPAVLVSNSAGRVAPGDTQSYFIELRLSADRTYPEQADFRADIYRGTYSLPENKAASLEIPFEADSRALADETRTVEVGRDLIAGGQRIRVQRIEFSPLATYVDYDYAADNGKLVLGMIAPRLALSGEGVSDSPALMQLEESTTGGKTMVFAAAEPGLSFDSAVFSVEGVSAIEPSKFELVVDTEQDKILSGGPAGMTMSADPENGTITFVQSFGAYSEAAQGDVRTFLLDSSFADASGRTYSELRKSGGSLNESSGELVDTSIFSFYGTDLRSLQQPLRLTITDGWYPVEAHAELELLP